MSFREFFNEHQARYWMDDSSEPYIFVKQDKSTRIGIVLSHGNTYEIVLFEKYQDEQDNFISIAISISKEYIRRFPGTIIKVIKKEPPQCSR